MKFPLLRELATKDVITVDFSDTLDTALTLMHRNNQRNVIVENDNNYYILTSASLLYLKLNKHDFSKKIDTIILEKIPTINKNENILDTLDLLESDLEYICVTNDNNSLYGIITHTDIISHIDPETLMENYRIGDLINMNKYIQKSDFNTSTSEVLKYMLDGHYDCMVITKNDEPIGIITTKDIITIMNSSLDITAPIKTYMSSPIKTVNEKASIKEVIAFIKEKHFKRVIITNNDGKLIGLILQKELISLSYSKWAILMKEYSSELSQLNDMLEKKTKKFEEKASIDHLTKLYNRYKFTELFISEYNTMLQRDNNMSLMMLDIDKFKLVNDNYGHNAGDKVLVELSQLLAKHLRNVDIIARWGGEEFVVLLPTADVKTTEMLANRIREELSTINMGDDLYITSSFGVTGVKAGDRLEDTIQRADDALYKAKDSGRNCVIINI